MEHRQLQQHEKLEFQKRDFGEASRRLAALDSELDVIVAIPRVTSGMDDPSETVRAFMAVFVRAWPLADASGLSHFFSAEAVYVNGALAPVRGRATVVSSLTAMMAMGGEVGVDILHLIAAGPIVMTERVDYWSSDGRSATLRVAGVFEVRDGVIAAWRDYFDGNEFASQLSASH